MIMPEQRQKIRQIYPDLGTYSPKFDAVKPKSPSARITIPPREPK